MSRRVLIALYALLLCACMSGAPDHAVNRNTAVEQRASLQCNKCMFHEEKGTRRIRGTLRNATEKHIDSVVADVELKDMEGKVVTRRDGLRLFGGAGLGAQSSKEFSEVVGSEPQVTQTTLHFRDGVTGEVLGPPVTLLLIVALED